jgi:hypothetical protein
MSSYPEAQYVIDELSQKINQTGWYLKAPTDVQITNFDEAAKITWTDPEDAVLEGVVAAQWAGTVVVRKEGSAPTSATDGTVVTESRIRNQYKDTPLVDSGLTNGTTYYYGVFPFTSLGQYTTSSVTSFTPSEILPVVPVINSITADDGKVEIDFTSETADALIKIVYKIGSAPTSVTDGTVVNNVSSSPVEITGLTNDTTYFFALYAYTAKRQSEVSNIVSAMPRSYIAYAFHLSESESNPNSMITFPAGYANSNFTDNAYMNFSTGAFHLGDWADAFFIPRSCMLKYDGTVAYYLDENDETKRADGSASDVANSSFAGNAMMEWGQNGDIFYWKIVPDSDGNGFTFVVANKQLDDDMQPWNFYNSKGEVASHFYTPKYFGSSDGTRLRSISGGTNYVSQTATTETTAAKANNPSGVQIWDTEVYADWLFIDMLLLMMCKSTNTQAKYGYGRCSSSNSAAIGQGTMNGKGMFWGDSTQTNGVKVFGMENYWGNIWRRIAGLINVSGTVKAKLTYGKQDGTTVEGYNQTGNGYNTLGSISGTSGGYTSKMNISAKGLAPKTISGSDSTYYTDGAWFNNSQTDYAYVGGSWYGGLRVGALFVDLDGAASYSSTYVGAALSCKPLA